MPKLVIRNVCYLVTNEVKFPDLSVFLMTGRKVKDGKLIFKCILPDHKPPKMNVGCLEELYEHAFVK